MSTKKMSKLHQPHDKLVKSLLKDKETAIEFFRKNLPPETLAKLDLSTLKLSSETWITSAWKSMHNDLVFCCKTKKGGDTYLPVEHQSTPVRFMPVRMLRYKMNALGKYLDAKQKPKKLPNVIGVVLYHGQKKYPYAQDLFSCFEDPELAKENMFNMGLIDLADTPEDDLLSSKSIDSLLKLLLKYSRNKDFVEKMVELMKSNPDIFVSLSESQAQIVFEYILNVGKANPENIAAMKTAISQVYRENNPERFYSLMDYFKDEAKKEGRSEGKKEGLMEGKKEGLIEGKKEGLTEGKRQGLIKGKQEGLTEGKRQGLMEGKKEGLTEGKKEGLKQGLIEGKQKRDEEIALQLLTRGLEKQLVSEVTGLSIQMLEGLKK